MCMYTRKFQEHAVGGGMVLVVGIILIVLVDIMSSSFGSFRSSPWAILPLIPFAIGIIVSLSGCALELIRHGTDKPEGKSSEDRLKS